MLVKFEVRRFNHFGTTIDPGLLHADTHTRTDRNTLNEHIISAIHFVHLAEMTMMIMTKTGAAALKKLEIRLISKKIVEFNPVDANSL